MRAAGHVSAGSPQANIGVAERIELANGLANLSKGVLARNVIWNLLGAGMPLLVAIIAIPLLIDGLGTARFGVLTLAWMVVGYFSLFDLGLGRALTKLVAEKLGTGDTGDMPELVWTALLMMVALGFLGAGVLLALSPWLVQDVLNVPAALQQETLVAFYLLAAAIPVVLGGTGFRGILEAHQRFGMVNAVRIPLGMFVFLGPVAVLPFSQSLVPVVTLLLLARVMSFSLYAAMSFRVEHSLHHRMRLSRRMVAPLISFGGWMTVTNIVGPLMVYMDRFLIGAVISMTAVAYYATPYEVVTKLWIIPGALMGVVFPAFAAIAHERARAARLYHRTLSYIFVVVFPMVILIVAYAHEGLTVWLGSGFAGESSVVMKLLVIGVFINSHAFVPFGLLQGAGRADLTAKLHLAELPFYLALLWFLLHAYGINGVAVAWIVRVGLDALLLFVLAQKFVLPESPFPLRLAFTAAAGLLVLLIGAVTAAPMLKMAFVLFVLIIYPVAAWFVILQEDDKQFIRVRLQEMTAGHR